MRLNLFAPYRSAKAAAGSTARSRSTTGKRLEKLAPTWRYSPVRRIVQSLCFVLFLALFFVVAWPYGGAGYVESLRAQEIAPAELFLLLDPLANVAAAVAARAWTWALAWSGGILLLCLLVPRGFCGYVCPMGTLIDLFDWAFTGHVTGKRKRPLRRGWWTQLRYYVLTAVVAGALCGAMLAGFVTAIPVVTRGMLFVFAPLEIGLLRGWHQIPALTAGQVLSVVLLLAVLGIGFLRPRFWCAYVCPTGAFFSVGNLLRLTERKVSETCIECGKCVAVCPFDAIRAEDYGTRFADCTFCQTCGGACPVGAISFETRQGWPGRLAPDARAGRPCHPLGVSRRGVLVGGVCGVAAALCARAPGAISSAGERDRPMVRPPGSLPEKEFLALCVRCGLCIQACPNNALQAVAFERGGGGLWAPRLDPSWSGCEPSCANCGQVCPTGAIRALPLEEKKAARVGLAIVDRKTCFPYAGTDACQLCVDECRSAGYDAIEFVRVGTEVDDQGVPVEGSGHLAPVVLPEKCNGCGLCETRCHKINVRHRGALAESAIVVEAGPGREDRMGAGSYVALREAEELERRAEEEKRLKDKGGTGGYLPSFLE